MREREAADTVLGRNDKTVQDSKKIPPVLLQLKHKQARGAEAIAQVDCLEMDWDSHHQRMMAVGSGNNTIDSMVLLASRQQINQVFGENGPGAKPAVKSAEAAVKPLFARSCAEQMFQQYDATHVPAAPVKVGTRMRNRSLLQLEALMADHSPLAAPEHSWPSGARLNPYTPADDAPHRGKESAVHWLPMGPDCESPVVARRNQASLIDAALPHQRLPDDSPARSSMVKRSPNSEPRLNHLRADHPHAAQHAPLSPPRKKAPLTPDPRMTSPEPPPRPASPASPGAGASLMRERGGGARSPFGSTAGAYGSTAGVEPSANSLLKGAKRLQEPGGASSSAWSGAGLQTPFSPPPRVPGELVAREGHLPSLSWAGSGAAPRLSNRPSGSLSPPSPSQRSTILIARSGRSATLSSPTPGSVPSPMVGDWSSGAGSPQPPPRSFVPPPSSPPRAFAAAAQQQQPAPARASSPPMKGTPSTTVFAVKEKNRAYGLRGFLAKVSNFFQPAEAKGVK